MPGRWPGKIPQFAGKAWSPYLGRSLDEFLRNIHKGMSNLQGTPGTPEDVSDTADAGVGPVPANDDHVHRLGIISAKGSLITHDGSDPVALLPGTNEYVLAADSTAVSGVAYSPIAKEAKLLALMALSRSSRRS